MEKYRYDIIVGRLMRDMRNVRQDKIEQNIMQDVSKGGHFELGIKE